MSRSDSCAMILGMAPSRFIRRREMSHLFFELWVSRKLSVRAFTDNFGECFSLSSIRVRKKNGRERKKKPEGCICQMTDCRDKHGLPIRCRPLHRQTAFLHSVVWGRCVVAFISCGFVKRRKKSIRPIDANL